MLKTEIVRARVTVTLKKDVEDVLEPLGLSMSEAIILFLSQVRLNHGLPFEVKVPNLRTRQTFEATDQGIGLTSGATVDEFFETLNSVD
jgi:DNA-damage-inducible protein J